MTGMTRTAPARDGATETAPQIGARRRAPPSSAWLSAAGNHAVQRVVADERDAGEAERSGVAPAVPGAHLDTSARAGRLAQALHARAVTHGNRVAFAPGAHQPGTADGRALLAHELTHVAQQQSAGRRVVRRSPRDDVVNSSITPEWAAGLGGEELAELVVFLRTHLEEVGQQAPDFDALSRNLLVLQTEAYRREVAPEAPVVGAGLLDRPAGLPVDQGYTLVPAPDLPPDVVDAMPEGQLLDELPSQTGRSAAGQVVDVVAPPLEIAGATSVPALTTSAQHLRTYGFAAAGEHAIGVVSFPQQGSAGHGVLQSRLSWGHTATYVRVNGQIVILRSHAPTSLLGTLATDVSSGGGVKSGRIGVPGSFYGDTYVPRRGIPMWTHTGAHSYEVPVTRTVAMAAAEGMPEVGPSNLKYTGVPAAANLCQGMNCVRWAVPHAERAMGGPFGPVTPGGAPTSVTDLGSGRTPGGAPNQASQGRMYGWMREAGRGGQQVVGWDNRTGARVVATLTHDGRAVVNALPEQATGPPVVGQMSRGMKYLRWGGRVFFVVGIVTGAAEIGMAEEGQRGRVATEVAAGFGGGIAGGMAAGAAAGLVCGPGAPVCSTILAIGGGIIGGIVSRSLVSSILGHDSAAYRANVSQYMGTLRQRTQGGWVYDGDQLVWEGPDPRYSAYASTIRRFDAGEIGGCQTCHEINYAHQATMERYGDPMPEGAPFGGFAEFDWVTGAPRTDALSTEDLEAIRRYIESSGR